MVQTGSNWRDIKREKLSKNDETNGLTLITLTLRVHTPSHDSLHARPRHVARISSRLGSTWRGPKASLPKTENSFDLAHYFWVQADSLFISYVYYKVLLHFSAQGAMAP